MELNLLGIEPFKCKLCNKLFDENDRRPIILKCDGYNICKACLIARRPNNG